MAEDERSLRGLYALRPPEPAEDHLGEDEWLALATGGVPAPERERAIEHVVRCGPCARVYRALSELEEGARRVDRRVPEALGPASLDALQATRWVWWGGVAAAATIVWAIAQPRPALAPAPRHDTSEMRGSTQARPVLLEPRGSVARWPDRLRWDPAGDARGYRVRILGGEGDELWTSPVVSGTSIPWPAEVPARAGRFYWQVTAYAPGATEADGVASVLARFEYQP